LNKNLAQNKKIIKRQHKKIFKKGTN